VLRLDGDLDAPSSPVVRATVNRLLGEAERPLVLDLSGVGRVYTAGILALADLQRTAAGQGREMVFCGARPFVRELLRITNTDRLLNLCFDLESALSVARRVV